MRFERNGRLALWVGVALLFGSLAIYWPVLKCGFVNYDDNKYITDNPRVQVGLTSESVKWAATTSYACNWHPLTWLSHAADCQLFDLNPRGHHLTSLMLHIANTLLLFGFLTRVSKAVWPSALVAALFGWHPAHVESVAWVAERKDVLSGLFFMLTLWAYSKYLESSEVGVESRKQKAEGRDYGPRSRPHVSRFTLHASRFYLLALFFFACGLMSKPMLVTLPFVLLLLDYWPFHRLRFDHQSLGNVPRLAGEKLPFFALAGLASWITMVAQKEGGAVVPLEVVTFDLRCVNALASYLRYAAKLLWPQNLAVVYPYNRELPAWLTAAAAAFLAVSTFLALRFRKNAPYVPVGWFWFLGMLVPVIGLVQVGEQAMADRYTYLPSIGFFLMIGWSAVQSLRGWPFRKAFPAVTAAMVLGVCGLLTRQQAAYWENSISLFQHAIRVTENNPTAHATLGAALDAANRSDEAIRNYQAALRKSPAHVLAHINYGVVLARRGQFEEAIAHYLAALDFAPDNSDAHFNLANAYNPGYVDFRSGMAAAQYNGVDAAKSREHYEASLRSQPLRIEAHVNWGNLELAQGRYDAASSHYQDALRMDPHSWLAHFNMGNLLTKMERTNEAIASFSQAIALRPDEPEAHIRLANLLIQQGHFDLAIPHLQNAVKYAPENWLVWNNLGGALAKSGRLDEATACLAEYLRRHHDNPQLHASLGRVLALQGKRAQAIAEYAESVALEPGNPETRRQLALLLEEEGKWEEAGKQFSIVVQNEPQDARARYELAIALVKLGETKRAIEQLREAVHLKPDWVAALNNLAWLLATDPNDKLRDGATAVGIAQQACRLTGYKDARVLGTLDAAYAEAGRFEEAMDTARKTVELARANGMPSLVESAESRLALYQSGRPYHGAAMQRSQ